MSIQLFRVDERLIHGQVVIGWGRRLHPRRFVVVDDELASSAWEQDLYTLAVDDQAEVLFLAVDDARTALPRLLGDAVPTILLTRDVASMGRLANDTLMAGQQVNLGGLHPGEGRRSVRGWLNVGAEDVTWIRRMTDAGVAVEARDLPDAPSVGMSEILPTP